MAALLPGPDAAVPVGDRGRVALVWWLIGLWLFVLLEEKLKVNQILQKFLSSP